jgi:hypothetical protein
MRTPPVRNDMRKSALTLPVAVIAIIARTGRPSVMPSTAARVRDMEVPGMIRTGATLAADCGS